MATYRCFLVIDEYKRNLWRSIKKIDYADL